MPQIDGFNQALKLLRSLAPQEQQRLLQAIEKKDAKMAAQLKENLIQIDDLIYMSTTMTLDLLKDVPLEIFARSLRLANKETRQYFLQMVSKGMKKEIEEQLQGPCALEKILEAHNQLMQVVTKKVNDGAIILNLEKSQRQV